MSFLVSNTKSHSGYSDDANRADGPPRNVLSNDTIRKALQAATRSASNYDAPPKSSSKRSSGSKSSSKKEGKACDCADCRDLSYREKIGSERVDEFGDRVREYDGEDGELRLHCHQQPEEPRRPSSSSSTASSGRRERMKHVSRTRDAEGNLVEEWCGAEAPNVRPHYDWDAPENQISFPDEGKHSRRR